MYDPDTSGNNDFGRHGAGTPGAGPAVLAVDFGTTYTTGALAAHGKVALLELDDGTRTPSAVFLPADGRLVSGVEALNRAATDPTAFERTPKRRLGFGSVLLAGQAVPDADVVAAVLEPVAAEARRLLNGSDPDVVCLTHPASWRRTRLQVLVEAARRVGWPEPVLQPEPVAAAFHYAHQGAHLGAHQGTHQGTHQAGRGDGGLQDGRALAVYDLGGGTFDAAVIRREGEEFVPVGEPGGIDPMGGVDFDFRLLLHLGDVLAAEHATDWSALMTSDEPRWVRSRLRLLDDLRRAKEALSRRPSQPVFVDGLNVDVTVTREELLSLVRSDVERTVATLAETISRAGIAPADLAGIYLVGGSSRISLVHDLVWERLGVRPATLENPKSVVALGAAAAVRATVATVAPAARPPQVPPVVTAPGPRLRPPAGSAPPSGPPPSGPQSSGPPFGPPSSGPPPLGMPPATSPGLPNVGTRKLMALGAVAVVALGGIGLGVGLSSGSDGPVPGPGPRPGPSGSRQPPGDLISTLTSSADAPCQQSSTPNWATAATSVSICKYSDGLAAEIYTWTTSSDADSSLSHWAGTEGTTPSSWSGGRYVDASSVDTGNGTKPGAYATYSPTHSILLYGDGSISPDGEQLMSWLEGRS